MWSLSAKLLRLATLYDLVMTLNRTWVRFSTEITGYADGRCKLIAYVWQCMPIFPVSSVAARAWLPPRANVFVAAPTPTIRSPSCYSYGYNDGISVDCEQYAKLGCKISEFHVFAPPNAALHSAARGGCPLPITPFPFPPPLGQLAMCVWESRGSSTDGLPAFAPLLKSPPTESPLQFHRLAIHRLLNSPTSYYTADKLHRLVNLRHDEFSTDEKSATGKETSGCRRRLIYRLRRLTVGSGPWKQRWAPHVML